MESDDDSEVNNNTYNKSDCPGQGNVLADSFVAANEADVVELRAEKIRDNIACYQQDITEANERIKPL